MDIQMKDISAKILRCLFLHLTVCVFLFLASVQHKVIFYAKAIAGF